MVRHRCIPLAAAATLATAAPAAAQLPGSDLVRDAILQPERELFLEAPLQVDGRYVVIRLAENRLYLMEGRRAIWSAPVGTGTGFRLERGGRAWEFHTPRGVFRVQRKEKDPVWIKPDWAFIEEGKPVPPLDSPLRRAEGMLGTSAIYIGYQLALHGTSQPELVLHPDPEQRRVSHGCIRLTNEDARTLYHLVDVGTPVLIY
ncbi:MAG TPA: L,D-transpeptidase [Longimicrobiales bacterium]